MSAYDTSLIMYSQISTLNSNRSFGCTSCVTRVVEDSESHLVRYVTDMWKINGDGSK